MIEFSAGQVIAILVLVAVSLYFQSALRVRELALKAVKRAARQDDFQLLDQSVHLDRISLSRDRAGRWHIWRQYRFDYSYNGTERLSGAVVMLGRELQSILVSEPGRYTVH